MKKVFCVVLAVATLAACEKNRPEPIEKPAPRPQSTVVSIMPVITRVTEANFENGDKIGLTISRAAADWVVNKDLTYAGGAFSNPELLWYPEGNDAATLKAYYPYNAGGVPTSFAVQADQSAGTSASDFLYGEKDGVLPTANAVAVPFKHKLARVKIAITNEAGYTIDDLKLQNAVLSGVVDADFNVTAAEAAAADITAYKADATTYHAIVIPQTVAFKVVVVAAGVEHAQRLVSMELKGGYEYTVAVRVLADDIVVSASGEIQNWNDGGVILPDVPVSFNEYETYFEYDGVLYDKITLSNGQTWMKQPLRFVPAGLSPSTDPASTGGVWYPLDASTGAAATSDELISSEGLLYSYPVAIGKALDKDNYTTFEGTRGICPPGWHIPTRAELFALCGNSNSAAQGESGTQLNESALFYDSAFSAGTIVKAEAAGWLWPFAGVINRGTVAAIGAYLKTKTSATTCGIEEHVGKNAMTYIMSSTAYKHTMESDETTLKNIQFFAMMSTFTATNKDGKLSLAYANFLSGYTLRCIKDAE